MRYLLGFLLIAPSLVPNLAYAQAPLKMDIKGVAVGVPTTDLPQECRGSVENGYTCSVDGQFNRMVVATTRNLQPNVVSSVGYRFNYTGEMPKVVQSISESYGVKLKASGKKYGRPMYRWDRPDGLRIDLEVESNTCYLTIAKKALNDADLRAAKEKKGQIAPPKF